MTAKISVGRCSKTYLEVFWNSIICDCTLHFVTLLKYLIYNKNIDNALLVIAYFKTRKLCVIYSNKNIFFVGRYRLCVLSQHWQYHTRGVLTVQMEIYCHQLPVLGHTTFSVHPCCLPYPGLEDPYTDNIAYVSGSHVLVVVRIHFKCMYLYNMFDITRMFKKAETFRNMFG